MPSNSQLEYQSSTTRRQDDDVQNATEEIIDLYLSLYLIEKVPMHFHETKSIVVSSHGLLHLESIIFVGACKWLKSSDTDIM